ncbi:MAG: 30S ribosomal protein S20 [Candidatus Omnitrophica bacterium]|nr:30S ribosomal protein S20 [Candidatus Omnitrophota bacterium]
MPIKRAGLRQLRKDRKRQARNVRIRTELKTLRKKFQALLDGKQFDEAAAFLRTLIKKLDQAWTKGLLHRNAASRYTSRLTRQLAKRQTAR